MTRFNRADWLLKLFYDQKKSLPEVDDDEDFVLVHVLRLVIVGVGRREFRRARFDRRENSAIETEIKLFIFYFDQKSFIINNFLTVDRRVF